MVLETIYVVRHGYRSNWVVNPSTGTYDTTVPSPTGIASDPALASYGVEQAEQLADKLLTLDPPIDVVYSSPFYRCLQTLQPTVKKLEKEGRVKEVEVRVDNGLSEFFGTARFTHPIPATVPVLSTHFPNLSSTHTPNIFPSPNGETIPALHDRYAYALHRIIASLDQEGGEDGASGPKAALLCTHAAGMICIGRVLTGKMPETEEEEDFKCGTCSLSVFQRRIRASNGSQKQEEAEKEEEDEIVEEWDANQPDHIPRVAWRDGKGVAGGWECVVNGNCEHLRNGEERAWSFAMTDSQSYDKKSAATDAPRTSDHQLTANAPKTSTSNSATDTNGLKQEAEAEAAVEDEKEEMQAKEVLQNNPA